MGATAGTILDRKGREVETVEREVRIRDAVETMARRRIGALVIVDPDQRVLGVVTERDAMWRLADAGEDSLDEEVGGVMTTEITTCRATTSVEELMELMTEGRFRHVPVVDDDDRLAGIVSIGDVVKSRIAELRQERDSLREYVTGSSY